MPRERLTGGRFGRHTRPGQPSIPEPVRPLPIEDPNSPSTTTSLGFDETTVQFYRAPSDAVQQGAYFRFGPFTVLRAPEQVAKIEIRKVAVQGEPIGTFLNRAWWSLVIAGGSQQEFQPQSRLNDPTGSGLIDPTLRPGVSFTQYGRLSDPQEQLIELAPGAELQLLLFTNTVALEIFPLSVYVRVAGRVERLVA